MLRLCCRDLVNSTPSLTTRLRLEFIAWTINPNNERILSRLVAVRDEELIKNHFNIVRHCGEWENIKLQSFLRVSVLKEAKLFFGI